MCHDAPSGNNVEGLTFEDVNVGDEYVTAVRSISAAEMNRFAAEFDPQPIHLDAEAARHGFFGEIVGSGWHAAVLTMRLMVDARPFGGTPFIGVRVDGMRFKKPFRPGDEIQVKAKVTGKRDARSPTHGYLAMHVTTHLGDGSILMMQDWLILLPRPAENPPASKA